MLALDKTLAYQNQRVVDKFRVYFKVSELEANELFVELLRWLWLCAKFRHDKLSKLGNLPATLNIQSGLRIVDEFWHIFLIHTFEYNKFCEEYFGLFVHHSPSHAGFEPPSQEETEKQLSYIYDNAGGGIVINRWYVDYAERYSLESLLTLRKTP